MKAVTKLKVLDEMEVSINLVMTVEEARGVLNVLKNTDSWPVGPLKAVLESSIGAAFNAYESEKEIG